MTDDFRFDDGEETPVETNFDQQDQSPLGCMDVYADIVYCIDLTASMRPIIEKVKETALTLHESLQTRMRDNYQRSIQQLRIRVVGFRDFYCDGKYALEQSEFFYLPDENEKFKAYVDGLEAKGGGDVPENSLEALAIAMQSDWCTTIDDSVRKRHVIIMFTDASAHPLEKGVNCTNPLYPTNIPHSYSELVDGWCLQQGSLDSETTAVSMDSVAKRLALFVPEGSEPWTNLADDFDVSFTQFIEPSKGGADITTEGLLKMIGETMV